MSTIEECLKSYLKSMEERKDYQQEIKDIISTGIEKYNSNLVQVKNYIEKKFNKSLDSIENILIERKYIKYCVRFWLQDTENFLLTERKSRIREIFNSLHDIGNLKEIPNPLNQIKYYILLKDHSKLVNNEDEKIFIGQFKQKCLNAYSDFSKKELVFLEAFINFLNSSKILPLIYELELENFCSGNLSFDKLINNIMKLKVETYGENLTVLQEKAKEDLKEKEDLPLLDNFKEVISAYIKPVEIQEKEIDNRIVVEVIGNNIVVSDILLQLEKRLSENPDIKEIHLVGGYIIHIDKDLKGNVWHGKNLVILTKTIKVHNKVTFDVSGKDNNHIYSDNAGTGEDGNGKQGKDGYPGESGGNVLILTEKIENPENFTVVSNGGKGSNGQNGGNGRDGKDGKGITKRKFDKMFPKIIHFFPLATTRHYSILVTITNIKNVSKTIITEKFDHSNSETFGTSSIFIEAKTPQGNEITFSYYYNMLTSDCVFCLYKGSLGQPGGYGGEFGLGGQGGYSGEITVNNSGEEYKIIRNTKQGDEGENGLGGLYGTHGINGWDMYYVNHQLWGKDERSHNENSKCTLNYGEINTGVWCPYKKKYALIQVASIEQKSQKTYEERTRQNTRQNNERQYHSKAVRKQRILQSSISDNYSHHLSSIDETLQNLRSDLEKIKQSKEQQKKQSSQLKVRRHTTYQSENRCYNATINVMPSSTYNTTETNVGSLINELRNNQLSLDNWFKVQDVELNLSQLNELFKSFENRTITTQSPQDDGKDNELQDIEKLLINKYRLAILQEITKQLPPYQEVVDNIELTAEDAAKYLIEAKENNLCVSHPVLGSLNQYLYENGEAQVKNISKFCNDKLQSNDEGRKIFEVEESKDEHFYTKQLRKENNKVYIKNNGVLSRSYRTLLADIFGTNIRLYVEDQYNTLILQDNHNPSSKQTIHVLNRDNSIIQLDIDENHLKLDEERKKKDGLCAKVLIDIETFEQKKEFDDYLNTQAYLSDICPLNNNNTDMCPLNNNNYDDDNVMMKIMKRMKITMKIIMMKIMMKMLIMVMMSMFIINYDCYDKDDEENDEDDEEEEDIKKIIKYFPVEERELLKVRLEKVIYQYSGQQGIVRNILKRFSSEGKYVSLQEMCYLINSILTYSLEDRKEKNIFSWIIAAYPQSNWINELILLQVENHCKKRLTEKSKWREYLSKIENKNILLLFGVKLDKSSDISTKCIENILCILSNIPNETVNLEVLGLSEWPYALKETYWSCKLSKLVNWQKSDLATASYYLLSIENTFGTDLVEKFLEVLEREEKELSPDTVTDILYNFRNEKWNLNEEELKTIRDCSISKWVEKMQQNVIADEEERDIMQLVELIKNNANTSKIISDNFSKIVNSIQSFCEEVSVINGKSVDTFTEEDIKKWAKDNIGKRKQSDKSLKEILAIIDAAIKLTRGFKLRNTQKLTILALLTNNCNVLAQVSTGEGKSLIVVAVSIIKVLCGEKVDITTSSSVLAKRDAKSNRDIYSLFNISVSHNCSENIEKRKEGYSGSQVVYGDLSNFLRDYLLDRFYGKNILGNCNFENVIVDEVDSMMLDKGNNMLYLSHDITGLDKLESVYIYIWQWINRPAVNREEIFYAFNTKAIKEAVIYDLYGLVKQEDIGKVGLELNNQQRNIIWERLIKAEMLDNQGKLLKESINDNELDEILSPEFSSYKDRLNYLLNECIERIKFIHVPSHLRFFVEQHLESWINSAIIAFFMKPGQDYVVDVDRTETNPDRNPIIIILDRDTGTDQVNSEWDEALHQFLQLKHGCKLSLQSLKAVFISNVSFFKLYKNLYGLTGTLGSQKERTLLQEIHKVEFVTIPTAKRNQFHEYTSILCTSEEEWTTKICNEVKELTTEREKRSVLIICETVNDVEILHKAFGGKEATHIHTYIRDYEEFDIVQGNQKMEKGQIIIATNLAGRGTDIKITEELREAGGLHVCLTYLPNNIRIEQQAFGRAARSGNKGSGRLIIMNSKGQEYSNLQILDLKRKRDEKELHRISDIKAYYETHITMEESCFKKFKVLYEQLKKDLDDKKVPIEVKEILLQSCLDKWAFWLDNHNKTIRDLTEEQDKKHLHDLLDKFISHLKSLDTEHSKSWLAWVEGNPVQMIKLGRYLSQNQKDKNSYESAIKLFNNVISSESHFSEAAHYYKAFALAKKNGTEDKQNLENFKNELREAKRLLDEHCKIAINAAGIISQIKKINNKSLLQIDAYENQQKSLVSLYYMFSQSIEGILGYPISSQSFVNYNVNEELAESIYKALLEKGILKKAKVKGKVSEKDFQTISFNWLVSIEELKNFLIKYKGKEIDEIEFEKALRKGVQLPSREMFWKSLIKQKVLIEEVKYIVVDTEKLKETDHLKLDFLTKKVNEKSLKKLTTESNNAKIFVHKEQIAQQNSDYVFIKDDFKNVVGTAKYQALKNMGVLSCNRKSCIDTNKIESTTFSCYDSITPEDFSKVNITKNEAEKILKELVERKVLEKKDDSENSVYQLNSKFDKIEQLSCPVYESSVKKLLSACFAYRIALQMIAKQLKEKNFPIHFQLMPKPHRILLFDLLEQGIITPVVIADFVEKKDLKTTIEQILADLVEEKAINDITQHIIGTLERSRSSLETLDVPEAKLTKLCEFVNVEEMHVLFLNGLDLHLQFGEKKWTQKMFYNTAKITAVGLGLLVTGALIELYTVGMLTNVATGIIGLGVDSLTTAIYSLTSGHFNWKDYKNQMLYNLLFACATAGLGALISSSAKVSRYGRKIAAFNFKVGGISVAEMYGTKLIETVGLQEVTEKVTKRILSKATKGIAFGLANKTADTIVENYLQSLCQDLGSWGLSSVKEEVERHKVSDSLQKAYETLGKEMATKMVNNCTNSALNEKSLLEQLLSISGQIVGSVNQGIAVAIKKLNKTSNPISVIKQIQVCTEGAAHIFNIRKITTNFLDNLDKEIKKQLDSKQKKVVERSSNEDYDKFKTEFIDQWKSLLSVKAGQVISQRVVTPLLKEFSYNLIKCTGKKIQEVYKYHEEISLLNYFEELKQEYKQELQDHHNTPAKKDEITEKYHKNVLKLMKKRNPKLFATIIRENIPMDLTCVDACTVILHDILKKQGIPGLTIIVEGNNGIRQTFSSTSNGIEGIPIRLELKDNHFQIYGSNTSENNGSDNNCLYEALVEAVPEFKNTMSPEELRTEIAYCVEHDKNIQRHIEKGFHQLPISLGAFGGARKSSDRVDDDESSSYYSDEYNNYEDYRYRLHNETEHFKDRLLRFIRLGGMIQRISEETSVRRENIVTEGSSEFQDQRSHRGSEVHAAHVVRGRIHSEIQVSGNQQHLKELKTFLGHTQNVEQWVNVYNGVGGAIDRFQSTYYTNLGNINFNRHYTARDEATMEEIQSNYIHTLNLELDKLKRGKTNITKQQKSKWTLALEQAINCINSINIETLFEQGYNGYSGKYKDRYASNHPLLKFDFKRYDL